MPGTGAAGDIRQAKEYRAAAKIVLDPAAKQDMLDAAARLERRAGKKARKVGRRRRPTKKAPVEVR